MKKGFKLLFGLILFSCVNSPKNNVEGIENVQVDVLSFLKDSIKIFERVEEIEVDGIMDDSRMNIHYYSISKDAFFEAINRNEKNIKYFRYNGRWNETTDKICKTKLKLNHAGNYMYVDLTEGNDGCTKNYFLENKIGKYDIIKMVFLRDAITVFSKSQTGNVDLLLLGWTLCSREKDSLFFYTHNPIASPEDDTPLLFLKTTQNKIDTLFYKETKWHTDLSFFDIEENTLYCIYTYSEDYKFKSTFVKMDFIMKE